MNVLVIGGGVMGTTTAYYLVMAGHRVTLVDRAQTLAAECSYANGGMLHAGHTEPWNTPAAIGQMVRWLGREHSPLRVQPRQIPRLAGWGLGFMRYSRAVHHERSTRINTRLAVYSQRTMTELREHTGISYDDARHGIIKLFRDADELQQVLQTAEWLTTLGVRSRHLNVEELVALEPSLADIRNELAGGILYPDDESGDPHLFTCRLGELAASHGLQIRLGETVTAIEGSHNGIVGVKTDHGVLTADRYVLATGAEAPLLAQPLGVRLPIRPVKGYSATLPASGHPGVPEIPVIDEDNKVVMTRLGARLRVSGLAEFAGLDQRIHAQHTATVIRNALSTLPRYAASVSTEEADTWACLRPMTVDGPPILGASPVPNLFLNTGAGHLGWTFAAGASRAVADVVSGEKPAIDLAGLTLDRFAR